MTVLLSFIELLRFITFLTAQKITQELKTIS